MFTIMKDKAPEDENENMIIWDYDFLKESLDFEVADKLLDGHFSLESFEDIGPLETLDWIVRRALRVSSTSLILWWSLLNLNKIFMKTPLGILKK